MVKALEVRDLWVRAGISTTSSFRPSLHQAGTPTTPARRATPPSLGGEVLRGVSLVVEPGQVHMLMGPNGSGKSTLALTLVGHPDFIVTRGTAVYGQDDLLSRPADQRAKAGLFLSYQHPPEVPGLTWAGFLRAAMNVYQPISAAAAWDKMVAVMKKLGLPETMLDRGLNEGFSGGERKMMEMVQLALLEPTMCVLDEIDSGLDITALKRVVGMINDMRKPDRSWLIITHYPRLADYITPDRVSFMDHGQIIKSGGVELLKELSSQ